MFVENSTLFSWIDHFKQPLEKDGDKSQPQIMEISQDEDQIESQMEISKDEDKIEYEDMSFKDVPQSTQKEEVQQERESETGAEAGQMN